MLYDGYANGRRPIPFQRMIEVSDSSNTPAGANESPRRYIRTTGSGVAVGLRHD